MTVRIQLRPAEQLEDPLLHPFGDDVLEALGLVVDLVKAVAEHLDEEHLQKAVVPDQLESDFAAFAGQLLAAVAVVLDEALGVEPVDHLADAWGRDAESLREITGGHRLVIAMQLVEGFEVILLGSREAAAALELVDQRA